MKKMPLIIVCLFITIILSSCSSRRVIIADFEDDDYGSWAKEGEAFGQGPKKVAPGEEGLNVFGQNAIQEGSGFVSSADSGKTGTLTSPPLRVEGRYLSFLFAGSGDTADIKVQVLSDGNAVRSLSGNNSRVLQWKYLDLRDLKNKDIQIRLVDNSPERNGFVMADQFYFSNRTPVIEKTAEFKIDGKYLNLPVKTGARIKQMLVTIDSEYLDEFTIELADSAPDFFVFIDLERYKGKKVEVKVDELVRSSKVFDFISVDNEVKDAGNLYKEPLRQQVHFSAKRGWNNDPNGMVYYDGEYHLFYQHNPYGWSWGNMHWGHAVSTDLVHWEELPEAIYPDKFNDWVFSGSGIMDPDNTSGFKNGEEDVMVLAYTSTGRGEAIAYSNDKGRTIQQYEGNPVVRHSGRDPKLIWYAPGNHWVMAVYQEDSDSRGIAIYTSDNLKEWTFRSKNPDFYECPEIFELPVDGNTANTKWIIYEASGEYQIGSFDGMAFTPETEKIPNNYGNCFYASQTFNNIPAEDARRIQIAWGREVNTPEMPFNQCMLFPTSLTLRNTPNGLRMFTEPVTEIEKLHTAGHEWSNELLEPGSVPDVNAGGELFHIKGEFEPMANSVFGFNIHGEEILYDASKKVLQWRDKTAELSPRNGRISFEIIADRNTIEVFCNDGEVYMPIARDLKKPYGISLISQNGRTKLDTLHVYELASIWE